MAPSSSKCFARVLCGPGQELKQEGRNAKIVLVLSQCMSASSKPCADDAGYAGRAGCADYAVSAGYADCAGHTDYAGHLAALVTLFVLVTLTTPVTLITLVAWLRW